MYGMETKEKKTITILMINSDTTSVKQKFSSIMIQRLYLNKSLCLH